MIGTLLNEALHETVHRMGVPEEAMLFGHVQIALTNALRGSNPFSGRPFRGGNEDSR